MHESKINLTPMLDVVFIMLIFFIVTAVFVREEGIDLPLSNEPAKQTSENKAILIDVAKGTNVIVAGEPTDVRLVRPLLERLHAQDPEKGVVIRPHPESLTYTLVR